MDPPPCNEQRQTGIAPESSHDLCWVEMGRIVSSRYSIVNHGQVQEETSLGQIDWTADSERADNLR